MKIALTWDYELFFGTKTGSVEKCMLQPTSELLRIANTSGARFTFFPDVAWLTKEQDERVIQQIQEWNEHGHETGLHIHPHWEDCNKHGDEWIMNLTRYKLSDFSKEEAALLIHKYSNELEKITGRRAVSFRAGGWCAQPFSHIQEALHLAGIRIDSSVFPGGKNLTPPYHYDFSDNPKTESWRFENELCTADEFGKFTEFPIESHRYSPLFFWKLFGWGRLNPSQHKPIGDGFPAAGGGNKLQLLSGYNLLCVSADGYFVTQISKAIRLAENAGRKHLVIIGHPKACTRFSLDQLQKLMNRHNNHDFVPLHELIGP